MISTIEQVKKFLDREFKKYAKVKDLPAYLINLLGTKREDNYQSLRARGAGQTTILKFLGKTWTGGEIGFALNSLKMESKDCNLAYTSCP
jgi:hypothetical protein